MQDNASVSLRVDRDLFQKFRYIADAHGRSANREMIQLIKARVAQYEQLHGPIELDKP